MKVRHRNVFFYPVAALLLLNSFGQEGLAMKACKDRVVKRYCDKVLNLGSCHMKKFKRILSGLCPRTCGYCR
ncbi:shTK domain protein [Necator americanus]|uniref:ShTK domain protein n=1 Tax=Necator americanus TaxID=51031 RepID=W2TD44_NECAM|nr:shTK domain protein [Necator americanus]ETN79965.1 shTK domain protein [Necator americanus]